MHSTITDEEGNVWFRAVMFAFGVKIRRMSVVRHIWAVVWCVRPLWSDLMNDTDGVRDSYVKFVMSEYTQR